uniref:KIAA0825 n=1 Tax=Naja naja TaxID=35670 RepID=A0A8C6VES2_NAJNA
ILQEWMWHLHISNCSESEPEVVKRLKSTLINSVIGTVKEAISLMHSWEATEKYGTYLLNKTVPESLLSTVPKEWNYIYKDVKTEESGKCFTRLAAQVLSIVISRLPSVIACLPSPVKYFFLISDKKIPAKFIESEKYGFLVKTLIIIICQIFEDGNITELLTGVILDRWSKEKLSLVCICLETIIGKKKKNPKQVIHKIIQSIEQENPNWIEKQLLKAKILSTECTITTAKDSRNSEEETIELELTEQKINMMALDICHKPGGSEYLRQIYHIIQLNEDYLNEHLSYEGTSEENPANIRPLRLILRSKEQPVFDPFQVHHWYYTNVLKKSAYCPQQSWVLNLPTPRGWKAESTLSLVGFEPAVIAGSWNLSARHLTACTTKTLNK